MRVEGRHIYMSRRNLLALLAKLDGNPPSSACTIVSPGSPPTMVTAEEDDVHYAHVTRQGAPPGVMHPDTEAVLSFDDLQF